MWEIDNYRFFKYRRGHRLLTIIIAFVEKCRFWLTQHRKETQQIIINDINIRWWICRGSISTKPSVQGRLELLANESLKRRGNDVSISRSKSSKGITAIIARSPLLGCQKPTTNADPFTNMPEQKRCFNPHRMLNTVIERDLWEEEWLIRSLTESSKRSSFSSIAQGCLLPRQPRMGPVAKTSQAMYPFSGRSPRGYSHIWPIRGCAAWKGMAFFISLPRESVLNRVCNFLRVCPNYKQEVICLYSPGFTPSIQKQWL